MSNEMSTAEARQILRESVNFRNWRFCLFRSGGADDNLILSAPDPEGREWIVPTPETKSSLILTAFMAAKEAVEIEMLTAFLVDGEASIRTATFLCNGRRSTA